MNIIQAQVARGIVEVCGANFRIKDKQYPLSAIPLLIFQEIANVLRIGDIERHDYAGRISRTCSLDAARLGFSAVIHCRRFAEISEIHLYVDAEDNTPTFEIIAGVFTGTHWVPSEGDYSREEIKYETCLGGLPLSSPASEFISVIIARARELAEDPNCFFRPGRSFERWGKGN